MLKKGEKMYTKFDAAKIYLNAFKLDDMNKFFLQTEPQDLLHQFRETSLKAEADKPPTFYRSLPRATMRARFTAASH